MTFAVFDTLQAARALQDSGVERQQAEAIAQIVSLRVEDYATKADLTALEARLGSKINTLEAKIETIGATIDAKVEQAKNVILRSILTASVAIIVTLLGGIFAVISTG